MLRVRKVMLRPMYWEASEGVIRIEGIVSVRKEKGRASGALRRYCGCSVLNHAGTVYLNCKKALQFVPNPPLKGYWNRSNLEASYNFVVETEQIVKELFEIQNHNPIHFSHGIYRNLKSESKIETK